MNLKLLFPSYRTRYLKVFETLRQLGESGGVLNLGCGEGDYDTNIREWCRELHCCDINEEDVRYCQTTKRATDIRYSRQDAERLGYRSETFDCVLCIDVLEHVSSPVRVIGEINRVLKPNAFAIITVPSRDFPWTYDPVNKVANRFSTIVPFGAFGFGHTVLMDERILEELFEKYNLEVLRKLYLSKYLVGLLEMYWVGFAQKIAKANAANVRRKASKLLAIRPDATQPKAVCITDCIVKLDELLFKNARSSIGLFYLLRKTVAFS